MKNTAAPATVTNQHSLFVGQEVKVYQPAVWLVYDENGAPVFGVTEHWIRTVITAVNNDPDDWSVRVEKGAQLSPDWNQEEFSIEEIEISGGEVRLRTIMD